MNTLLGYLTISHLVISAIGQADDTAIFSNDLLISFLTVLVFYLPADSGEKVSKLAFLCMKIKVRPSYLINLRLITYG